VEPWTVRRVGATCIFFGVIGLVYASFLVVSAATGAAGLPSTLTVAIVAVQSVLNLVVGLNLRRRA